MPEHGYFVSADLEPEQWRFVLAKLQSFSRKDECSSTGTVN